MAEQRDLATVARALARRFHDTHQREVARAKRCDPIAWDEMAVVYQRRLVFAFDSMLRRGLVTAGPVVGFTADDDE